MKQNKIKSFEDACKALKLDPKALPVVIGLPEKHQASIVAHYKLVIIAEALNAGWVPDWTNWDETKYYPWFDVDEKADKSGLGLSCDGYDFADSNTTVCSRLCFQTSELAEYAGKQFQDLYETSYLIK